MLVLLDVQTGALDDRGVAESFRGLVNAMAEQNRLLLRKLGLPKLYDSGVLFRNEPWATRLETLTTAPACMNRGWGDCAHLSAWRIAELREEGIDAGAKIYWRVHRRPNGRTARLYHVEVRLPDGSVEDPSRYLGM